MENIRDLPIPERPREQLKYHGAASLSDEELLAILLGLGTSQAHQGSNLSSLLSYYQ